MSAVATHLIGVMVKGYGGNFEEYTGVFWSEYKEFIDEGNEYLEANPKIKEVRINKKYIKGMAKRK